MYQYLIIAYESQVTFILNDLASKVSHHRKKYFIIFVESALSDTQLGVK